MISDFEQAELSAAIRAGATRHQAPADLRAAIRTAVAQAAAPGERLPVASRRTGWTWLKLGTAFAAGVLLSLLVMQQGWFGGAANPLAEQVVAAHVRSLMAAHLEDVASSDQHTVKPWFGGKLDYSPPVSDFASHGFPLAGGRLDYIGQRPVAALIYQRRGHVINAFVWPLRGQVQPQSLTTRRDGYHLIAASHAGMQYWIISDLNDEELQQFSRLLQSDSGNTIAPTSP